MSRCASGESGLRLGQCGLRPEELPSRQRSPNHLGVSGNLLQDAGHLGQAPLLERDIDLPQMPVQLTQVITGFAAEGEHPRRQLRPFHGSGRTGAHHLPDGQRRLQRNLITASLRHPERPIRGCRRGLGIAQIIGRIRVTRGDPGGQRARCGAERVHRLQTELLRSAVRPVLENTFQQQRRLGEQIRTVDTPGHRGCVQAHLESSRNVRRQVQRLPGGEQESTSVDVIQLVGARGHRQPEKPRPFLKRELAHGLPAGPLDPRRRPGPIARYGRDRPVPREIEQVPFKLPGIELLDRLGGPPVQQDPLRTGQPSLDRIPHQRVREAIPTRRRTRRPTPPRPLRPSRQGRSKPVGREPRPPPAPRTPDPQRMPPEETQRWARTTE